MTYNAIRKFYRTPIIILPNINNKKRTPLPFACGGSPLSCLFILFTFFLKPFFVPVILSFNLFRLAEDGWPIDCET